MKTIKQHLQEHDLEPGLTNDRKRGGVNRKLISDGVKKWHERRRKAGIQTFKHQEDLNCECDLHQSGEY